MTHLSHKTKEVEVSVREQREEIPGLGAYHGQHCEHRRDVRHSYVGARAYLYQILHFIISRIIYSDNFAENNHRQNRNTRESPQTYSWKMNVIQLKLRSVCRNRTPCHRYKIYGCQIAKGTVSNWCRFASVGALVYGLLDWLWINYVDLSVCANSSVASSFLKSMNIYVNRCH